MLLEKKIALVTGSTHNMGLAIASRNMTSFRCAASAGPKRLLKQRFFLRRKKRALSPIQSCRLTAGG